MAPSDVDYVRVDIPTTDSEDADALPRVHVPPPTGGGNATTQDEEGTASSSPTMSRSSSHRSSAIRTRTSLLRALWSEATSTTDLPLPPAHHHHNHHLINDRDHRLHHRRAASSAVVPSSGGDDVGQLPPPRHTAATVTATSSIMYPPPRGRRRGGVMSLTRRGSNTTGGRGRGAKIATRVWLSAFAAFGASFLIGVHLYLFRAFSSSASAGDVNDVATRDDDGNDGAMMVLAPGDRVARMTMAEARAHVLSTVGTKASDVDGYTVRINTWRRNEQLSLSLNHHAKCDGVTEIHVIWCDGENDPPEYVVNHPSGKVRVERHVVNSLNERFRILIEPPTLGILSLDDDVLRPCIALDAAFVRWTRHPDRMVGFDARTHVVVVDEGEGEGDAAGEGKDRKRVPGTTKDDGDDYDASEKTRWKYGYMSTTETSNKYSITLPRASFVHRDYLDLYTDALPRPIYEYVANNLECEDVAMSFLVSSLTDGKPPLLADYWAVKSMIKLYSERKISGGKDHKATRDACVNDFAEMLGLKEYGEWPLRTGKLMHGGADKRFFGYGAEAEEWTNIDDPTSTRLLDVVRELRDLRTSSSNEDRMGWLTRHKATAQAEAQRVGMIEGTREWKERWSAVKTKVR
ncbi:hypothetical protein ACHAXA_002121 [Cyclostephanos tholiformis]|uniref:Glycosyl transferase 64 domain-containing protein n=1 Tax=Cyclostephanos tholiformis TaxID=382380 RepID=A0ABD3RQW2_9STRA